MWDGSSSQGTEEPCLGDTGELSLRAYGGFVAEHRASAARSGADVSSLGRKRGSHIMSTIGTSLVKCEVDVESNFML